MDFFRVYQDSPVLGGLRGIEDDIAVFVDMRVCPIGSYED
jgi:hypothetical protein